MTEFFSRADEQMPSEFDESFRSLRTLTDVAVRRHGTRDEGYSVAVDVTTKTEGAVQYLLSVRDQPIPPQGLYIVHESSLGIAVVFFYLTSSDRDADFSELIEQR